jgi:DNA-binding MarR family transcriptional regulator
MFEWGNKRSDTGIMNTAANRIGRPPNDRAELLELLRAAPRSGRNLARLNERDAARRLGWDRGTVMRALDDLERDGLVRRFRNMGHQGLLVQLLT